MRTSGPLRTKRPFHLRQIDRSNAFFIMLHSAAVSEAGEDEDRAAPELDRRFEPLLEKLYQDPALERIIRVPAYQRVFRRNVRGLR